MKLSIVHDWLVDPGGAERVLAEMLALWPGADLFAVVSFPPRPCRVTTSFVQHLPFARRHYRAYLPLMPFAVEHWDLSGYDLVLSSSHAVAKGAVAAPGKRHVAYVHTPMRYAWDMQDAYLRQTGWSAPKQWLAHRMLERLRRWDLATTGRVNRLIANSGFVAGRIARAYGRDAVVVSPPVDTERFRLSSSAEDFYLVVSRLVPYKRVDLVVDAFAGLPDARLIVIGDGPEHSRLAARRPANVTLLGRQSDAVVADHMARCRAYVLAGVEDFGIAPLEAQACGKPVVALQAGGACETLAPDTALFFAEQTVEALRAAIVEMERRHRDFDRHACRANALRFAPDRFRRELAAAVEAAL